MPRSPLRVMAARSARFPRHGASHTTTTFERLAAAVVLAASLAACQGDEIRGDDNSVSVQDSIATVGEIRASLEGGTAPGRQSYLYRGLYAGMTRAALESMIGRSSSDSTASCHAATTKEGGTTCMYDAVLGSDNAPVAVSATYTNDARSGSAVAREITVVRELPIAVDGVRVVKGLADAFAAQTTLLDRRESTYGHHLATVRMGTIRGARENYATVVVEDKHGREEMTVTLTRTSAPAPVPRDIPASRKAKG